MPRGINFPPSANPNNRRKRGSGKGKNYRPTDFDGAVQETPASAAVERTQADLDSIPVTAESKTERSPGESLETMRERLSGLATRYHETNDEVLRLYGIEYPSIGLTEIEDERLRQAMISAGSWAFRAGHEYEALKGRFDEYAGSEDSLAHKLNELSYFQGRLERELARVKAERNPDTETDTPKEGREALKQAVGMVMSKLELAKRAGIDGEKSVMKAKEDEYIQAYKDLERKRTIWEKLRNGKSLEAEEKRVRDLKASFDEARIAYAEAIRNASEKAGISESFEARSRKRFEDLVYSSPDLLPRDTDGSTLSFEIFLKREHARRTEALGKRAAFHEVVRPMAERKLKARHDALDSRKQGTLAKGLGYLSKQSAKLDTWTTDRVITLSAGKLRKEEALLIARGVRAVATAGVLTGAALATGGIGAGLVAGTWGAKATRSLVALFGSEAAARFVGGSYETADRARGIDARDRLERMNAAGKRGDITLRSLTEMDRERSKLVVQASEREIARRRKTAETIARLAVGGAFAASVVDWKSMGQLSKLPPPPGEPGAPAPEGKVAPAGELLVPKETTPAAAENVSRQASTESQSAVSAEAPRVPTANAESNTTPAYEATIGRGEGFNTLFEELRDSVPADRAAEGGPVMNKILNTDPTELSRMLGAYDPATGESMVMQPGDRLHLNGDKLWLVREGMEPQLLMEADATGAVTVYELEGVQMSGGRVPVPAEAPAVPSLVQEAQPAAPLEPAVPAESEPFVEAAPEPEDEAAPEPMGKSDAPVPPEPAERPVVPPEPIAPQPEASTPPARESIPTEVERPEPGTEAGVDGLDRTQPFVNPNQVPVDPRTPAAYESTASDGSKIVTIYGGSGDSPFYAAQQAMRAFTEKGLNVSEVRFEAWDVDPITGEAEPYTGAFRFDAAAGQVVPTLEDYPSPDPDRFTNRLAFDYRPTRS